MKKDGSLGITILRMICKRCHKNWRAGRSHLCSSCQRERESLKNHGKYLKANLAKQPHAPQEAK